MVVVERNHAKMILDEDRHEIIKLKLEIDKLERKVKKLKEDNKRLRNMLKK